MKCFIKNPGAKSSSKILGETNSSCLLPAAPVDTESSIFFTSNPLSLAYAIASQTPDIAPAIII